MPDYLDNDGQPLSRGINWKRLEDSRTDELIGICRGIMADGLLVQEEASFVLDWLERNEPVKRSFFGQHLFPLLTRSLKDGVMSPEEEEEIVCLIMKIIGGRPETKKIASYSTALPLDDPPPKITYNGMAFCFTGKFEYGTRKQCQAAITTAGGIVHTNPILTTCYLVIGDLGSRDWAHSSNGRKIEKAIEIRDRTNALRIISEPHWVSTL